jgi:hypothetical protein
MKCPCCGAELRCIDYYGKTKYADHYYLYPRSWIEKEGDIFQCQNCYGHFYTDSNGNLHEGYPC